MRKICSQGITFLLLLLLLSLGACQEFIHNSFDTFTGKIVDAEGKAVTDLELILTQDLDFGLAQPPVAKSIIYKVKTTNRGEFRMVVPARTDISFNTEYFLLLSAPAQFELINVLGQVVHKELLKNLQNILTLPQLEAGFYGVVVTQDNKRFVSKLYIK